MTQRLLLLDDEVNVLHALVRSLRRAFGDTVRVECLHDPVAALARVREMGFDVIISDFRMPGMTGTEFLSVVKEIQPDAIRLMLSASADFTTAMAAINEAEAFRFITKPWDDDELVAVVRLAFERRALTLVERRLADEQRLREGLLTVQEREARMLEALEPGLTQVRWGPDGSVLLEE